MRVCIVQSRVPKYREAFFNELRRILDARDVLLELIAGDGGERATVRGDGASIAWSQCVEHLTIPMPGRSLKWHRAGRDLGNCDLLILESAGGVLSTTSRVSLGRPLHPRMRVAVWGIIYDWSHADEHFATSVTRKLQVFQTRRADHVFAYTQRGADDAVSVGVAPQRITVVRNSTESEAADAIRMEAGGLPVSKQPIGLYLGALEEDKRVLFAMRAAEVLHREVPAFTFRIAGSGTLRGEVDRWAAQREWVEYLGPVFGPDKARLLAEARVILAPGRTGLVAVDGLRSGTPIAGTGFRYQGPEFDYLVHGSNSLIVPDPDDLQAYVAAVRRILEDDSLATRLASRGLEDSKDLTAEAMAERFAAGIMRALAVQPR